MIKTGGIRSCGAAKRLREYRAVLNRREPVIVQGRVRRDRQGHVLIVGEKIKPIG